MKQNAIIYQIFPRNHSKEGTFKAIELDLPRIKRDVQADIIYLMPINEIGILNRKGTYGSPYASKDYFSISSDLGTLEDLKSLINKTHELGMDIILDMVFNHTSPDNVLLKDHEDYYFHRNGRLGNRVGDWTDIIDLDTNKKETQDYLISVLKYWVSVGFDGFRFDVASMIPLSFFIRARKELGDDIIFIGESISNEFRDYLRSIGEIVTDDKDMYPTFDALYNYNYFRALTNYMKGKGKLRPVINELNKDKDNLRLLCIENHDNDRVASFLDEDRLEEYLNFLSFIKGNLFIYAGQEYGNKHKPELFEKDPVDFNDRNEKITELYQKMINDKRKQKEIIDISYEYKEGNLVTVTVKYIDSSIETKTFNLN